ncbi:MAG: carboxyl-terminal protease [Akkermansiaceae bacterium]|nr:carboxyl-terminal protease [Akkermansiaceae bacterium]
MNLSRIRSAAFAAIISSTISGASAEQANFDEVGRQMSIMLQNNHFAKLPFSELSGRFLDDYLKTLDSGKVYFTQQDVDRFKKDYGDSLAKLLLEEDSMKAAKDIYDTFRTRVTARVTEAKRLLATEQFDFTKDEAISLSRKKASWPKDEGEAMDIWRKQVKEAMLSETLRREMIAKLAKEQGKPDPTAKDKDPKEKLALRYERFLRSVTTDVDSDDVAAMFLSAVARSFDPHTDYMSAKEMERFTDMMRNELVGIGALLKAEEDGATKIMGIVIGGPADKQCKLKLNDRVLAVDPDGDGPKEMVDIMFMKIDKVVDFIRGQEGENVTLKVEPAGGAPGQTTLISIQRDKVELKDEQASAEVIEMKRPDGDPMKLGVITLPSFYADFENDKVRCSVDVERLLERLKAESIDGLLFDIRNNGGGSLSEVQRMTGFFTRRGPVVQVKDTIGKVQVKESENKTPIYDGPMIVLTDKSSASASEILAGALQDDNRAVIVGESSTFGKGTVQQPMGIGRQMPFFAARSKAGTLKVTIQKFYRPSGSSTQHLGVIPDIKLPSLMDVLEVGETYLDHPLEHDVIAKAGDFQPLVKEHLFIPRLAQQSAERVAASKDFAYINDEANKVKERIKENKISLNMASREKEIGENDKLRIERNAERRNRFAVMEKADKDNLTFYKISLDDLSKGGDLRKVDPTKEVQDNMKRAKDETEELDDTPKWPSALDPQKSEGMSILGDLIDVTRSAKMAGLLQKSDSH